MKTNTLFIIFVLAAFIFALAAGCEKKTTTIHEDQTGPVLQAVVFSTGGAVDTLTLRFDEGVLFSGLNASDFILPVTDDSLGTGPTFDNGVQAFDIVVTLGAGYVLTPAGDYDPAYELTGDPSGLGLAESALSKITDNYENECQQIATAAGALDIED